MSGGKDHVTATNERLGPGPLEVHILTLRGRRVTTESYYGVLGGVLFVALLPLITGYAVLPPTVGPIVGTSLFIATLLALVLLADPQHTTVRYTGDIRRVHWNGHEESLVHPKHHVPVSLVYEALAEEANAQRAEQIRAEQEPAKPVDAEDRQRAAARLRGTD
jgi:hypothetical protein